MEKNSPPAYPGSEFPQQECNAPLPQAPPQLVTVVAASQFLPSYGPHPQRVACPYCHKQITTRVNTDPSMKTHLLAVLLCLTCCLGCLPYCVDSCQNRNHYCPQCSAFLGTYDGDGVRLRRF